MGAADLPYAGFGVLGLAPARGEHDRAILTEIGRAADISRLAAEGVLHLPERR